MADLVEFFERAVTRFGGRVSAIGDQWAAPTPDAEWDVRALVNHVLSENPWAPPLLSGSTITDVGDRFDGDQLGADPEAARAAATELSIAAVAGPGALDRTVHVSFGDISGQEYVSQLVCDHVIHAWDLDRAIGTDEAIDADVVDFAHECLVPQARNGARPGRSSPRRRCPPAPGARPSCWPSPGATRSRELWTAGRNGQYRHRRPRRGTVGTGHRYHPHRRMEPRSHRRRVAGATGPAVGARFRGSNRRGRTKWATTCEVTAAEPGREFAFVTGRPAKPETAWRYVLEPAGDGATLVTESFQLVKPHGTISNVVTRVTTGVRDRRSDLEENVRVSLARLKDIAEA